MSTQYSVRVYEAATKEETTLEPTWNDTKAIDFAEREAERLAEHLAAKMETDDTRVEPDGWGRYLVWLPTGDESEEVAYVVTVEEVEADTDKPVEAEAIDDVTPTNEPE